MTTRMWADSCAFFQPQTERQLVDPDIQLDLMCLTAAPPAPAKFRELATIHHHVKETAAYIASQDRLVLIRTRGDLEKIGNGKTGVVLMLQSPPEDMVPSVKQLYRLREQGVLFMTLAYDQPSRYGGGFANLSACLTDDGQKLMDHCEQAGITIDLSHANAWTAADALSYARERKLSPVVATHTAAKALYDHPRSLNDAILKAITDQGGFVGVLSVTSFIHGGPPEDTFNAYLEQLNHVEKLCGGAHVCIGSDGYYLTRDLQEWRRYHEQLVGAIDPTGDNFKGIRWPDQPLELNRPDRMKIIHDILIERGKDGIADLICGRNFYNFLQDRL